MNAYPQPQRLCPENRIPNLERATSIENADVVSLDPENHLIDVVTAMIASPGFAPSPANNCEYLGSTIRNDFLVFPDAKPRDLAWQYDVSTLRPFKLKEIEGSRYSYSRIKSLSVGDCKSLKVGHAARMSNGVILDDGSIKKMDSFLVFWRDGQFWPKIDFHESFTVRGENFDSNLRASTPKPSDVTRSAQVQLGVAFTQQYFWGVKLGIPGRQLRISSDPAGIRDFFNLRDVGPKGRREALKNWVNGHWRKLRRPDENEEARTWVRQHLRGKLMFRWNGIDCEIAISQDDLKKNAGGVP